MTSEIVILITELRNKQRITLPAGATASAAVRSVSMCCAATVSATTSYRLL